MPEQDLSSSPFEEKPLSPEDYANLVEIVSWVNQVIQKQYPGFPSFNPNQVKIVQSIADVEKASAKESLHPFFLSKVEGKVQFGGDELGHHSWVAPDSNTAYFDVGNIKDMRKDKRTGYLGIGFDLINYAIKLGTEEIMVESEKANQMANDMVLASFSRSLEGIVTANDTQEALDLIREKSSKIRIRGMTMAIMVEDKMFMGETGKSSDFSIMNYLARPVRLDYARLLGSEFNLSPTQRARIEDYAGSMVSPDIALTQQNLRQVERDTLASLDRMGFRGRNNIMSAYQAGDIGRKIIETH